MYKHLILAMFLALEVICHTALWMSPHLSLIIMAVGHKQTIIEVCRISGDLLTICTCNMLQHLICVCLYLTLTKGVLVIVNITTAFVFYDL